MSAFPDERELRWRARGVWVILLCVVLWGSACVAVWREPFCWVHPEAGLRPVCRGG